MSKDPIGLEGGLNLYVFCGNNPVNFVDPWGEDEIEIGVVDELASVLSEPIDIALSKIRTSIGKLRNNILGEPELDPNETPVFEPGRPQFLTGDDLMDFAYLAMTRSGGRSVKLGASGKPRINTTRYSTQKAAKDAARAAGNGKPIKHPSPRRGSRHYHPTNSDGTKKPGTHYEY